MALLYFRSYLGIAVLVLCVLVFADGIAALLQIGTCSSTGFSRQGPVPQCPEGSTAQFWTLIASVFGCMLAPLIPPRAASWPGGRRRVVHAGVLAFPLGLTVTGATAVWVVAGPNAEVGPDARLGGLIMGILFLVMGIVSAAGFAVAAWLQRRQNAGFAQR